MNIKICFLLTLLIWSFDVSCRVANNFTTNIRVLDNITKNLIKNQNNKIFNKNLSKYTLFRAIILNKYILYGENSSKLPDYFCKKDDDELMKLLKWKIVAYSNSRELQNLGIKCDAQIELSKNIMKDYFLNVDFYDAQIEYYYYLVKLNKGDFFLKNSILRMVMYSKPDITVLELLIDNLKEKKLIDGEWNASILAARYGSSKGFSNMIMLLENKSDIDFIRKIYGLLDNNTGAAPDEKTDI